MLILSVNSGFSQQMTFEIVTLTLVSFLETGLFSIRCLFVFSWFFDIIQFSKYILALSGDGGE